MVYVYEIKIELSISEVPFTRHPVEVFDTIEQRINEVLVTHSRIDNFTIKDKQKEIKP